MHHWIEGRAIAGSGMAFSSVNPADGTIVWQGNAATAPEVNAAVSAARSAFAAWSRRPLAERISIARAFGELLNREGDPLARCIAREIGKPLWEARSEVATMAAKVAISIQAYAERTGEQRRETPEGASVLRHRPHGVMAVFGPYNFPGHLPNGHIVPALLAGNTAVFKPSEFAPATALATAELWARAGLPDGVLNVINGGRETGVLLAQQEAIDGLLFTGSYRTGAALHQAFAGRPEKILALEMGGNNPLVVWPCADRKAALHHTLFSAFVSAGQRCTCARRLIVPEGAAGDTFIAALVEATAALRVGAWDAEPQPFMGPVVSSATAVALLAAQENLLRMGARPLLAMRSLATGTGFLAPGILDLTGLTDVPDEEYFGPLLQVYRVPDFDTALAAANRTRYGLAAGLLADDASLWQRFENEIRAGIVNWNRPTTGAASSAPFGGIGHSGNHRPSAYYAADYCAYPVASMTSEALQLPAKLSPGMVL